MRWPDEKRCRWESPGDGTLERLPERAHPDSAAAEAADLPYGPPDRLMEQSGVEGAVAGYGDSNHRADRMRLKPAGTVRPPPSANLHVVSVSFTVFGSAA